MALVLLCTPCTNPPSPAPYGCELELEGERCKTMDRIVIGGPFKTEELRPKGLTETKSKLGCEPSQPGTK